MRAPGVMLAAGLACGPVIAEPGAAADPVPQAQAERVPAELRALGVAIDPAWAERATVWVVGTLESGTYPCRPGPDGSLDMIVRDSFTVTRVLRGELRMAEIDVDAAALRGPGYPAMLVEGRSYLLMLAPTPELAPRLADPQGRLSMYERLDRGQIVAVVDLSQSAAERASEAVLASRSVTHEGVRFDPERWAAARAAPVITAEHAGLARFIGAELLARPGGSVAELRAWLGAPDVQQLHGEVLLYRYWLARPGYERPVAGGWYGQVELRFLRDQLRQGSVRWFRWEVRADGSSSSFEVTGAALRERGLAAVVLEPAARGP